MDPVWFDPSRVMALLKESLHVRVVLSVLLSVLLFAPDRMLELVRLRDFRDRFGFVAGIFFLPADCGEAESQAPATESARSLHGSYASATCASTTTSRRVPTDRACAGRRRQGP